MAVLVDISADIIMHNGGCWESDDICAGLLRKKNDANTKPVNGEVLQENYADTQTPVDNMITIVSHDKAYKGQGNCSGCALLG